MLGRVAVQSGSEVDTMSGYSTMTLNPNLQMVLFEVK